MIGVSSWRPRIEGLAASLCWLGLLILPAVTTLYVWQAERTRLLLASCWLVLLLRLVLAGRLFYALTYPFVFLGLAAALADEERQVDLMELAAQWRTFSSAELHDALAPYAMQIVAAAVGLACVAWIFARVDRAPRQRRRDLLCAAVGSVTALAVWPSPLWLRAWPLYGALTVVSAGMGSTRLASALVPGGAGSNPRDPSISWGGHSLAKPGTPMTAVLVIGETLRADALSECGARLPVHRVAAGALVACDVSAGADATHTSVPLLVSRGLPGWSARVPRDPTFMRAFGEAGFETHWYSVQDISLAWADADFQSYLGTGQSDAAALLPRLRVALDRDAPRKAIVLHAYNAHGRYCDRYDAARAPYAVDCKSIDGSVTAANLESARRAYANAVDASVVFLDAVIEAVDRHPEPAFVVYTADHGENLLDDGRQLYGHALRRPTRWDIGVPAVFWANRPWQDAHPGAWARLQQAVALPLMHADIVPTLLAAADVAFDDPRQGAYDLLAQSPPAQRHRIVQAALGETLDWRQLLIEAR